MAGAALVLAGGCGLFGGEQEPSPPLPGGTIRGGLPSIGSLDPADATGSGLVILKTACDGLVALDHSTGELRPALASSWKLNEDAKGVRLNLRSDYRFHDGSRVDARAVAANLARVARPVTQSPWAGLLDGVVGFAEVQSGVAADLSGVKVIDSNTLEISLSGPQADFPLLLAHPGLVPISPAELSKSPEEPVLPVCAGPYRIKASAAGENSVLSRERRYRGVNRGFLETDAAAEEIQVFGFGGADEALEAFQKGEVDAAPVPASRAGEVHDADRVRRTNAEITYLAFDPGKTETADPKLRQAISLALDRFAIIDAAFGDGRQAMIRWLSLEPGDEESKCSAYARRRTADPEGARQLFGETGIPPGMKLPLVFDVSTIGRLVAQAMRVEVKDAIGVDLEPMPVDPPAFDQSLRERTGPAVWIMTGRPDLPAPQLLLDSLFFTGGKNNRFGFTNTDFDAAVAGARATVDADDRGDAYSKAEEIACEQMQSVPLWTGVSHWAAKPGRVAFAGVERIDVFGDLLLRHAREARALGSIR